MDEEDKIEEVVEEEKKKKFVFPDAMNCSVVNNYTQISNDIIRNPQLSFKARGILILFLSNKEGWHTFVETISTSFSNCDGRTSIASGIKELEELGYVKKYTYRDGKTKAVAGSFIAYTDVPFQFNLTEHDKIAEEKGFIIIKKDKTEISQNLNTGNMTSGIQTSANLPSAKQQQIRLIDNKINDNETNLNNSLLHKENTSFDKDVPSSNDMLLETEVNSAVENNIKEEITNLVSSNNILQKSVSNRDSIGQDLKQVAPVPKDVESIITLWVSNGLTNHKPGTKTFTSIIKSIRKLKAGTFYNTTMLTKYHNIKFNDEDIKLSIKHFALAATSPDFLPKPSDYKEHLKKTGFTTFLYNERAQKEKSLFIKYFEEKPEVASGIVNLRKDSFPELTEMIKKVYVKRILGGANVSFDANMQQKFILASQLLNKFFADNRSKINQMYIARRNVDYVDYLISAIIKDVGEANMSRLSVGWLSSGETFSRRLPSYLYSQGILTGK